nr:hypothetical protein Iba_chr01dCG2720 [Ipomoea batatas]
MSPISTNQRTAKGYLQQVALMEREGGDDGCGGEAAPFPAMMDLLVVSEEASFPANCRPHLSSLPFFADNGIEGPLKLITGSIELKLTVVASIHKANIENLQDICTEDALWLSNIVKESRNGEFQLHGLLSQERHQILRAAAE